MIVKKDRSWYRSSRNRQCVALYRLDPRGQHWLDYNAVQHRGSCSLCSLSKNVLRVDITAKKRTNKMGTWFISITHTHLSESRRPQYFTRLFSRCKICCTTTKIRIPCRRLARPLLTINPLFIHDLPGSMCGKLLREAFWISSSLTWFVNMNGMLSKRNIA